MNEVVNGIAERNAEIAVIARGTGWDFVRTYQIPRRIEDAVDVALNGATREIDLGRALYRSWAGADEVRWFANVASVGMSGAIAQRANETTKALGGRMSYLLATLNVFARWKVGDVRVSVDENVRGGRMHDVIVANGRYLGGGMMICPEAAPDDGLFDVLLIGDLTKRDLMLTLPKTYRGKHLPHPKAELLRGATVTVDAPSPLPVELDGEQPGTTPGSLRARPARASAQGAAVGGALRAGARFDAESLDSAATCFSSFAIRSSSALIPCTRFVSSSSCLRVVRA